MLITTQIIRILLFGSNVRRQLSNDINLLIAEILRLHKMLQILHIEAHLLMPTQQLLLSTTEILIRLIFHRCATEYGFLELILINIISI